MGHIEEGDACGLAASGGGPARQKGAGESVAKSCWEGWPGAIITKNIFNQSGELVLPI